MLLSTKHVYLVLRPFGFSEIPPLHSFAQRGSDLEVKLTDDGAVTIPAGIYKK